jgi:hypothetical protein
VSVAASRVGGAHGLVCASFVSPEPIRQLRDLTRTRTAITRERSREVNDHHAFLARVHLDLIDRHTPAIEQLTGRIEVVIEPFQVSVTCLHDPRDQHRPG